MKVNEFSCEESDEQARMRSDARQKESNLAAIIDELTAFAKWIRSGAVNHDDARDDMARALENRVRYLQTRVGSHRVSQCLGCEVRDSDLYALMQRFDSILGREIEERRKEQDAKHGGPEHDDTLGIGDWLQFIRNHLFRVDPYYRHQDNEDNLIDVAALAIAAVQSSRRKRNA